MFWATEDLELDTASYREAAIAHARAHQARAEAATRALLGRWVSEIEPTLAFDQEYRVIGLSHAGRIVLHAEP